MKKSYIGIIIFLLLASAGTYFAYQTYFLPIQTELVKNKTTATQLQAKIKSLEETFNKTEPPVVIKALSEEKQPWVRASRAHLVYFKTEEIEKAEIPQDEFPRFWYKDRYPKMETELYEFARERGVQLAAIDFGIKQPSSFENTSPTRRDVLKEVDKFNAGIAKAKFILEANPSYLERMEIWAPRTVLKSKSGNVEMYTTGYTIEITNENLMRFLERLNRSETYLNVNGIRIANRSLRNPRAPYTVELLVTTANLVN